MNDKGKGNHFWSPEFLQVNQQSTSNEHNRPQSLPSPTHMDKLILYAAILDMPHSKT